MRIAVVGSVDGWHVRDLVRAAGTRHEIAPFAFRRLAAEIAPGESHVTGEGTVAVGQGQACDLSTFDAMIVRAMPGGSLEQIVLRMDALGQLEAAGLPIINPPRAMEVAVDKYLATARLARAGLVTPRTWAGQSADAACEAFRALGGDVVLKPLFGSEGRGITRLCDPDLAERAFRLLEQLGAVIYLQRYVEHEGFDLRLLVLGDEVFGMRRVNEHDWRTNVRRGARAEAIQVEPALSDLARRAAAAVGAVLAGVDILPGRDGTLYAIEVNAVPGWKALAEACQIDVAARVLDYVEQLAAGRRESRLNGTVAPPYDATQRACGPDSPVRQALADR